MKHVPLEIHQTRRFSKQLQAMYKAGKNERVAAKRAEQILAGLQSDPLHEEAECKRTRHGELRLRDCRKYDLSCGFRLIGLKRDQRLIFTCIGSHDDCQRWIENNRDCQDDIESVPLPALQGGRVPKGSEPAPVAEEPGHDEYEQELQARLDDQLLRDIFAGLCQAGPDPAEGDR